MYHQVLAALLLQLCCAAAAPIANDQVNILGMSPQQQYGAGGGIFGFIVLVLDIIVWIEVLKSNRPPSHKLLWSLLVFIFPIIGVIVYFFFSDRQKWNSGSGGYEAIQ